jgi:DNA-binding transcriptional ArsR family regulator
MESDFTRVASLIGDPVRSMMLWSLLDGRAYTATELAVHSSTSLQNASMHLKKLLEANLLVVEKQGRHRYFKFRNDEVAYAIEALAMLVPKTAEAEVTRKSGVRFCRTCYDHLAGEAGVRITEALVKKDLLSNSKTAYTVTGKGIMWFKKWDINIAELSLQKRSFARKCLDWSERKHHLAGALGAALLDTMIRLHWVRRVQHSRSIIITSKGQQALYEELGLTV